MRRLRPHAPTHQYASTEIPDFTLTVAMVPSYRCQPLAGASPSSSSFYPALHSVSVISSPSLRSPLLALLPSVHSILVPNPDPPLFLPSSFLTIALCPESCISSPLLPFLSISTRNSTIAPFCLSLQPPLIVALYPYGRCYVHIQIQTPAIPPPVAPHSSQPIVPISRSPYPPQRPCHSVSPLPKLPTLKHIMGEVRIPGPTSPAPMHPLPILHSLKLHSQSPSLAFTQSLSYPRCPGNPSLSPTIPPSVYPSPGHLSVPSVLYSPGHVTRPLPHGHPSESF